MGIRYCSVCQYYEPLGLGKDDSKHGFCHRYPPFQIIHANTPTERYDQPIVESDDWCGEGESLASKPQCTLKQLDLSVRARRGIRRLFSDRGWEMKDNSNETVLQLCTVTGNDLLQLKNFGPVSLEEVKYKLEQNGYNLS